MALTSNDTMLIANALKIADQQAVQQWRNAQIEVRDRDNDIYTLGPFDEVKLLPSGVVITLAGSKISAMAPGYWLSVTPREDRR